MPSLIFAQGQVFALLEEVPLGIFVFRLEDPGDEGSLRIVFANRATEEALGIVPATVVGSLIGESFPNITGGNNLAAAYRDVAVSKVPRHLGVVTYGDEAIEESRFAVSAYPLGNDMVAIFFENLSASPLRRQELGAIVDSATDAIISKDLDGTILSWNRSAEGTYGYPAGEAIGQKISMLLPTDRPTEVDEIIARLRAGERIDQFETQRVRKDGAIIDVSLTISPLRDIRGDVVGAATIARDISEKKQTAVQLQWLAAIVAASEDAITSRTSDGTILTWNTAAERLLGYSAAEMVGESVDVLDPPEIADDIRKIRASLQRGERQERPHETSVRHKDGSELRVSVSSFPITDSTGDFVGIASVMRDVTEHRRLEDQLRQAQKMEAIGSLAGGVAHDFNNILTVILTASEAVLGELAAGALHDKVRQIDLAAEHGATLTAQLLAYSRRQVLQPEPIDLNDIVGSTCEMAGRLIGEHVRMDLQLEEELSQVEMDRGQLQQVILNLFINARDAMPDGGVLNVRTSSVALDETYVAEHFEVSPGPYVLLEITDSGIGMDVETTSRIFDPFFTTKTEGTGLGLATVHGIVKQSGGQISVYSEPGIGTTFKVYLPPASGTASLPEVVTATEAVTLNGAETIVLVEDGELLRSLVAEILESRGYTVLVAADGFEALAIFETYAGVIDLLLTDVVMPGMSGHELANKVMAMAPDVRVVFTSGYPDDSSIRQLIAERQVSFIQKPYAGSDLLETIRATFARAS
jgi:two-component system, cell cycle sensor histidine kinase and response regulator CckA